MKPTRPTDWEMFDGPVLALSSILDYVPTKDFLRLAGQLTGALGTLKAAMGLARVRAAREVTDLIERMTKRKTLQPVRLQNRDRSTAASIAQVHSIAKNPDPDLLGFSKTATDGAPIVFADYDELKLPDAQLGRKATITFMKDMSKVPVRYAVVPSAQVMVSHDANGAVVPGYDALEAPKGMLRAVAGNGRAAGIKLAYDRGSAGGYVAGLIEDAGLLQIDPDVIEAMEAPMLVRIMRHEDVSADIGDKTNSSGTAAFSAVEQAKNDAERVDLAALQFNEDGTPTMDALTRFVNGMPLAERAVLAPDGRPTTQALDRLMAATFSLAYQDDELVKLYSQSLDPEIKNVLFGMAQAAGDMAALKSAGQYDIRGFVTQAAGMASNAKRSGLPLSRMAEQRDMGMPEAVNDIAAMLARNARSAKRIADALRKLARAALEAHEAPDEDLYGPVEKRPPEDVVRAAMAEAPQAPGLLDSVSQSPMERMRAARDLTAKVEALSSAKGLERLRLAKEVRELLGVKPGPTAPKGGGQTAPTLDPANLSTTPPKVDTSAAPVQEVEKSEQVADKPLPPKLSAQLQEAHRALGHDVTRSQVQRMRDLVAHEVETGTTNNGGVTGKLNAKGMADRRAQLQRLDADLALFAEAEKMQAAQPKTWPEAKAAQEAASARVKAASATMDKYPKSSMGLTPDAVKASPQWRADKAEMDAAMLELQRANSVVAKSFAKESAAERDARRAAKLQEVAPVQAEAASDTDLWLKLSTGYGYPGGTGTMPLGLGKTARKLYEAMMTANVTAAQEILHPDNKRSREAFESLFGGRVKLPKTVSGTNQIVADVLGKIAEKTQPAAPAQPQAEPAPQAPAAAEQTAESDPFTIPKKELNRLIDDLISKGEAPDMIRAFQELRKRYVRATGKPSIPPIGSRYIMLTPEDVAAQDAVLTAPTRADIEAQQARAEQAARDKAKADRDAEAREVKARELADIKRRSEAAAASFVLGGDALANLSGQQDVFGGAAPVQAAAQPAPKDVDLGLSAEQRTYIAKGNAAWEAWRKTKPEGSTRAEFKEAARGGKIDHLHAIQAADDARVAAEEKASKKAKNDAWRERNLPKLAARKREIALTEDRQRDAAIEAKRMLQESKAMQQARLAEVKAKIKQEEAAYRASAANQAGRSSLPTSGIVSDDDPAIYGSWLLGYEGQPWGRVRRFAPSA